MHILNAFLLSIFVFMPSKMAPFISVLVARWPAKMSNFILYTIYTFICACLYLQDAGPTIKLTILCPLICIEKRLLMFPHHFYDYSAPYAEHFDRFPFGLPRPTTMIGNDDSKTAIINNCIQIGTTTHHRTGDPISGPRTWELLGEAAAPHNRKHHIYGP